MLASKEDLFAVLRQYNPWWYGTRFADLPRWRRAAFNQINEWLYSPPAGRALLLTGARQVGKTTLFLQAINRLLDDEVNPSNILYATFDHALFKLVGLDTLLGIWREFEPPGEGTRYLFLDEIQVLKDWQTWIKHQVDFAKNHRVAFTGSAMTLADEAQESGVGRWQTVKLATLSFFEYLQIKDTPTPDVPALPTLKELFEWESRAFTRVAEGATPLVATFNEYLLRGGFPQSAKVESIDMAQRLLREDIVDKVLKRDMTAQFGVRRILELEQVFLYLCLHDGGLLDIQELSQNLEVKKQTANNFIHLLETTHLIYRLLPHGYGKQILRARPKIYLADPALAGAAFLRGRSLLENTDQLARAVETAFFKHVFTRYYRSSIGFSYWRGKRQKEVDIIAETGSRLIPFEVKYRSPEHTGLRDLKGLRDFCIEKGLTNGYAVTREMRDFGITRDPESNLRVARIPAPLACYWLGQSELEPDLGATE